jgi:DNA-binding transcriptional ArsR family regulator
VITAELGAATLAATRLAASPAIEIVEWLRLAAAGRRHPRWGDTGPAARAALSHPDVQLVAAALPTGDSGYTPDLLTPKPEVGTTEHALRAQLESIAGTPAEVAEEQLLTYRFASEQAPAGVRAAIDAGTFARRAASGMWRFWRSALVRQWSALESTLEAEISVRAAMMARSGVGAVLGSLHPRIQWRDGRLEVLSAHHLATRLTAGQLVLVPSVLTWPPVATQFADPAGAMLMYPAAGPDTRQPRPGAVPELVGRSRAALLGDLGVPRSTTELSKRHGLAPATVSYHLGVLLRAGLVTRIRERHLVYYRRNAPADALLTGAVIDIQAGH